MEEISWRTIQAAPDYEVSSSGAVRSKDRTVARACGCKSRRKGRALKTWVDSRGYAACILRVNGKSVNFNVHRLVAAAFCDPSGGPVVRHLDGNKLNNVPENLKWGTTSENYADSVRHGTAFKPPGAKRWNQRAFMDADYGDSFVSEALG